MKLLFVIPGTGDFHCGSCLRDAALMRGLGAVGHEVTAVPMYLPWVLEEDAGHEPRARTPLFFGGINTYLDASAAWARRLPAWLRRGLDATPLLRLAARLSHLTSAGDLGRLSVSMIADAHTAHRREIDRLAHWIDRQGPPDVICLSNSMLIGIGAALADRCGAKLVCSLQGEDAFVDALVDPYRQQTWQAIGERAPRVARFIAPSRFYARRMAEQLGCPPRQIATVYNGTTIATDGDPPRPAPPPGPLRLGYLARMHPSKGLDRLVDTWATLQRRPAWARGQLVIAGAVAAGDRRYVRRLQRRLDRAGLGETARWHANVTRQQKLDLLRGLGLLCVPTTLDEAFGLYLLEAWACGLPVVVPRRGALPELCDITGGGWLYDPDDPAALAATLEAAAGDPAELHRRGQAGRNAVARRFTAAHMAEAFADVLGRLDDASPDSQPDSLLDSLHDSRGASPQNSPHDSPKGDG